MSCRRARALGNICPNTWYYTSRARYLGPPYADPRDRASSRFSYVRIWIMLRREGWPDNKKRIHRLYCLEGLQVRLRTRRKKRLSLHRGALPPGAISTGAWTSSTTSSSRAFRVLTVIDPVESRSVLLEANVALTVPSG